MKDIGVIDTGLSNIHSVIHAFEKLDCSIGKIKKKGDEEKFRSVILPGVGSFKVAMKKLKEKGLDESIYEVIDKKVPFLGICLGMQLLLSESEEFGKSNGINIVSGKVKKFRFESQGVHVPHVGWNEVQHSNNMRLFESIDSGNHFYFVHSYFVEVNDKDIKIGKTDYADKNFISCIETENIFATQFHPEKSGKIGIKMCSNFKKIIKES